MRVPSNKIILFVRLNSIILANGSSEFQINKINIQTCAKQQSKIICKLVSELNLIYKKF